MPYYRASNIQDGPQGGQQYYYQYLTSVTDTSLSSFQGYIQGISGCWGELTTGSIVKVHRDYLVIYETPEEIASIKAVFEERTQKAQAAASMADQLLISFLSDAQADQYRADKRFDLTIKGRTYRICKGRSGNIQLIEGGKPVAKYCAHPEIWTPDGDTLLAQVLMLQTNEAEFLRIANRTSLI